jgi:comEA protein
MIQLTRQEKQVILFLFSAGLLGIGVLCYKNLAYQPRIEVVSAEAAAKEAAQKKIVNINTAAKEELVGLPGIGPALAEAIMEYRDKNGAFRDTEELKSVNGIGPAKFERIRSYIRTE